MEHRTAAALTTLVLTLGACSAGPDPAAPGPIDPREPGEPSNPYEVDDVVDPKSPDSRTGGVEGTTG